MILSFHGINIEENELIKLCNVGEGRGASWFDAKKAVESLGLEFFMKVNSTIDELKSLVDMETPVIVGVDIFDLGWDNHQGHTIIILEVNGEIVYHDPQRGAQLNISKDQFIEIWKKRDNRLGYILK